MEKFRRVISHVPTGVLSGIAVALILWLTLSPHPTGDLDLPLFPGADKIVHALIFGFLCFVVLLETMKHRRWQKVPLAEIGVIAIICALFGVGIEILQRAMGLGRTFETLDILADSFGAIGVGGVWAMFQDLLVQK